MLKRVFLAGFAGLGLIISTSDIAAQSKKPSQALRQVTEHQKRSLETFDSDLANKKAEPYEWEQRTELLKQFAAEQAAGFKPADWKGEELLALATLYQRAELFTQAVGAYRAYLAADPKARKDSSVTASLTRALIETESLTEAENMLEGMAWVIEVNPMMTISRLALHKDLVVALADRGSYENAAEQAKKGYLLAESIPYSRPYVANLKDTVQRDQMMLAALAISSYERAGKKKDASDFLKTVETFDFLSQPALKTRYEAELAIARTIGRPAPELVVQRWLESENFNLAELRGKVLLLDFWAMWCSPCIAAYPHWRELQSKYAEKDFRVIGVTRFYGRSDSEENLTREQEFKSLQNYRSKFNLTWPIAVGKMDDLTNEELYGVNAMPTIVLIDRLGNVRHVKRGIGEYPKLMKQIERLLSEKN